MVYEECSVGEVVRRVYPDLLHCGGGGREGVVRGGGGSASWWGPRSSSSSRRRASGSKTVATPAPSPCSINTITLPVHSLRHHHCLPRHNTMTIVSQHTPDAVRVAVGERGVVGSGCLLSAMSGVEAPPEVAPSPPPSSPHPAHHTAHEDDQPLTTTTTAPTTANTVVSSSDSVPQVLVRSRRKLENEDSSYDSDFEPCEWTPASPKPEDDDQHDGVCRTVSDTLGAEFAEYVTIKQHTRNPTQTPTALLSSSVITRTDTTTTTFTSSSSSLTPHVVTSSYSSSSNPAVVTTPTSSTTTTGTTTTTDSSITSPVTSYTSITTPANVTTTTTATVTTTMSTTSVTSSSGIPESSVRATSPTARLPSSSPSSSPGSPSIAPPSVSVTPPAPVTATTPPNVTVTQATRALTLPCSSSTSSCSSISSSSTPAVTSSPTSSSSSPALVSSSSSSSEVASGVSWVVQHSGYASQVEFGVKLGYSEALVQQALIKIGGIPDKDELLGELIRLGTSSGRPDCEGDAADDLADIREDTDQQQQHQQQQPTLKPIIIDGSNVAMRHGNKTVFSCRGLRICVDWFRSRGHNEITVFVPAWRKEAPRWDTPTTDQEILLELEQESVLVFTPSRVCGGKRIVSYDDRYILNEAVETGGIVVSNDNYRDLAAESQAFRKIIEESLLMYSWVNGRFVPPDDPLGRNGPTLDVFLRKTPKDRQAPCPYGRKCTYGNKCKYMHPERGTAPLKSVTERLQEQAQRHYQKKASSRDSSPGGGLRGKSLSLPVGVADSDVPKKPLQRTQSNVPSVSLTLPSSLTQETPTHDLGSNTTTSTPSHTHRHLMPPQMESPHPLDPLRSSTMFKSESSLYHLYPSQGHQASYGSSAWGWESQSIMPSQGGAFHSQFPNYGAHMPLTKNLSDPDTISSDNPHKKLQRQLTLNPAYDSRLYKIVGFKEPKPEHFPLAGSIHQQQQKQAVGQVSPSRTVKRDPESLVFSQVTGAMTGRHSPGYPSQFGNPEQLASGHHQPLTRHSSSQEGAKHVTSLPGHLYPPYSHPHVTRFASAPDPIWGGGGHQQPASTGPPHITRLNSTSDTRLNLYGCGSETQQFISEAYDDQMARLPPFHSAPHHSASPVPAAPSPGPIGSRPMSPQQGAVLHRSSGVASRQHPTQQQHLPSQQAPPFPNPITGAASHEDARLRVYYHLSNLFPEAQVRAALAMYPEETEPHKICSSIFSINPGPVGSRPMSPQQPTQPAVSHPAQNVPVRGSSPLTAGFPPNPLPAAASSHEDARFRAFYHLSQLFPVAQVRAVLARYPDETDAQTLCATLIGLGGNQS